MNFHSPKIQNMSSKTNKKNKEKYKNQKNNKPDALGAQAGTREQHRLQYKTKLTRG